MQEFDYVIVGAGTSASVLARRLTQADPQVSICLLEAGGLDRHPYLAIPAGFVKTLYGDRFTWPFSTSPVPGLSNRQLSIPQGRVVGGSSSVNGLVYVRGKRADYDDWRDRGNTGWGYDDLLPYFKRSETKIGEGDERYRGKHGELKVTDGPWRNPLCDAFIAAARASGIPLAGDYNGEAYAGTGYFQRIIYKGRRVSASKAFLAPALATGRVELRTHCLAQRITFEGLRATGVLYRDRAGAERTVRARREVVLAAGTVNSPKLLQLSGIGPGELLRDLGIPVRRDLPGVGENLRDHFGARLVARARDVVTINQLARWPRLGLEGLRWLAGQPSILSVSPSICYAVGPVNAHNDDPKEIRFIFTPGSYVEGKLYVLDSYPGMTLGAGQLRPASKGHVRIVSPSAADAPEIQPNYLAEEVDQQAIVSGLRQARALMHSPQLSRYFESETLPGPSTETDAEWLDFARRRGNTGYHLVGTCRMAPESDPTAVVDADLRVRGIEGLRVVDASIMPMIPSANTFAATLAIAEKAADMIAGKRSPPRA
ncbi:GMC family oxidoreductase [Variovorax sp. LARHSF232]